MPPLSVSRRLFPRAALNCAASATSRVEGARHNSQSFCGAVQIENVQLVRDRETDKFKGFGFVEFRSAQDLNQALEVDGAVSSRLLRRLNFCALLL